MVDLKVLDVKNSTQDALKTLFTATLPSAEERLALPEETIKAREETFRLKQKYQERIRERFAEQITPSLQKSRIYSAVDLAWDAAPINTETIPLLLFGQGKLDLAECQKALKGLGGADKYTVKNDKGDVVAFDTPKFFRVEFNLVRSVITRRLAAQANKYLALYPHYKYESRSTSQVGKLRADILSQVMDIMTDGFDLRHHDMQVARDAMLYGHSVDFIRSKWEKEEQMVFDPEVNPDLVDPKNPKLKTEIVKEGMGFVNPHPTRVFWDNAYPMSSINCDVGPGFIGFWDVVRFGDIVDNPQYWNTNGIAYTSTMSSLFSSYNQYFSQYYCTIKPPTFPSDDPSKANDRQNNLGTYSQAQRGNSIVLGNLFDRIVPKDWGIGDYAYPVWLRIMAAGEDTVVYAEFIPSSPASYCGINENDSRQFNISIAMEILPYQDQMTQLLSLLMLTIQGSNFRLLAIDVDTANPDDVKRFRAQANGTGAAVVHVWEYSSAKLRDLGIDPSKMITLIQTQPSQAIPNIFQAMSQLVQLAERLMALSPHELGQPAPREISATETNMMAGTTETMYGFISDAIDEFRASKKRILYESWMACGDNELRVPVMNRYPESVIARAGFQILQEDSDENPDPETPQYHTVIGTKANLRYHYIFSSRDGAQRAVNTQSANVLTQLLGVLQNPMVMQAIKKEKFFEIINEIFRLSGAGVDLLLEVKAGESNEMGPDQMQQIQQVLQQLTQNAEQERQAVAQLSQGQQETLQKFEELRDIVQQLTDKMTEFENREPAIDPLKAAKVQHDIQASSARTAQDLQLTAAKGAQDLAHNQQRHELDMTLDTMKAHQDAANNGNGNGT